MKAGRDLPVRAPVRATSERRAATVSIGKFYPPPFRRTLPALAAAWLLACFVPTLARAADGPTDATQSANVTDARVPLHDNWKLQSECLFQATPEKISMPGFGTEGWHSTTVPMTVVAALVADKTYPDPYYAMNLRSIPGTDYPIGRVFSRMPMSKDSPFRCAWWYRTEFKIAQPPIPTVACGSISAASTIAPTSG